LAAQDEYAALAALLGAAQTPGKETYTARTTKWEYDFVVVSDITQAKFVEFLQDRENRGWEFNGTTTMRHDGKPTSIWVFRRPAQTSSTNLRQLGGEYYRYLVPGVAPPSGDPTYGKTTKADDVKAIEAEIARLQDKLAAAKGKATWSRVVFMKDDLPVPPAELVTLLGKLADRKFGKGRYSVSSSDNGIAVEGDKEVIEWFTGLVRRLAEK
jgi:hypothetical protein